MVRGLTCVAPPAPRTAQIATPLRMLVLSAPTRRSFSTGSLDLVLRQADSTLATVAKAQDLIMAGDRSCTCLPNPSQRTAFCSRNARMYTAAVCILSGLACHFHTTLPPLQLRGTTSTRRRSRRWWRALAAAATS